MAISGSLNFLSASEHGSAGTTTRYMGPSLDSAYGGLTDSAGFIPTDFVGLNINILDPVSASSNVLGHSSEVPMLHAIAPGGLGYSAWVPIRANAAAPAIRYIGPTIFNSLMLNRNGPYGYPMWKQTRGSEHPLSRHYRRNNLISIDYNNPIPTTLENASSLEVGYKASERHLMGKIGIQKQIRASGFDKFALSSSEGSSESSPELSRTYTDNVNLKQYYEPVLTTKYKPLTYRIKIGAQHGIVRQSLTNQMVYFSSPDLNSTLRIAAGDTLTGSAPGEAPFKRLNHKYYSFFHSARSLGATNFVISERIYPRDINSYRAYKLKRPNYEESDSLADVSVFDPTGENAYAWSGAKTYDKKPGDKMSFWKASQGGGSAAATSDGTTRLRTDGVARISISGISKVGGIVVEDTAIKKNIIADTVADLRASGLGIINNTFVRTLISGSTGSLADSGPAADADASKYIGLAEWNHEITIGPNGIIRNPENLLTGTLLGATTNDGPIPGLPPYGPFIQHETYQPYEITALSMWPLDPRQDIYDKPAYLTSSTGGRGLQIGLTPHRSGLTNSSKFQGSVDATPSDWPIAFYTLNHHFRTGSILDLKTGSAGELVYSTKPTLFFYRTGSLDYDSDVEGYGVGKASIQYHRHTYPYNSPFFATHKIRGINPFHNTYDDFFGDLKYVAKDYTIVPEYNISEHILDHYDNNAPLDLALLRSQEVFTFKDVPPDPRSKPLKLLLPRTEAWYGMPSFSYSPAKHKADFLSVDGASVTSSASSSFVENFDPGDLYAYKDAYDPEGTDSLMTVTETASYGPYGNNYTNHWARDRETVKFAALFGDTDNLKTFSNLLDQGAKGFAQDAYTIPFGIKFKCHAIKKMRIKDGFYPATRTTQIAKEFDEAFLYNAGANPSRTIWYGKTSVEKAYSVVNNTLTIAAMCKQVFLEPLFAPGVLFNSIKSGIAVDWPLYGSDNLNQANPPSYYCSASFLTNSYGSAPPGTIDRVKPTISASFNFGGLYMMGASRCYPSVLTQPPTHRLSFNALFDFKNGATDILANRNIFLPSDFVDLDRNTTSLIGSKPAQVNEIDHPGICGMAGSPAAILNLPAKNSTQYSGLAKTFFNEISPTVRNTRAMLYHSSINNFLCETMEFYLADAKQSIEKEVPGVKFPVIIPRRDTAVPLTEQEVLREKKLFMEIGLSMGLDQVMCEGPRRAGIPATSSVPHITSQASPGLTNFGNTMRGYIYGPPMEIIQPNAPAGTAPAYANIATVDSQQASVLTGTVLAADDAQSYFYFNLQDPAYQAYTPPYFYGESSKILSFMPLNTTDNYKEMWEISSQGIDSDFNAASQGGSFYYEKYNTGSAQGDLEALCLNLPNTASISSGSATRMKIDASLEFSEALALRRAADTSEIVDYTSYITPWWTCPLLDFSSSYSAVREITGQTGSSGAQTGLPISKLTTISNTYHDYTTGRGMWGGYGTDPYDAAAIKKVMYAENLTGSQRPDSKGVFITVRNIFADSDSEYNSTAGYVNSIAETPMDGFYTSTNLHSLSSTNTQMSASLAEKLGFQVDNYPIGAIAPNKKVNEAIIVIPYLNEKISLRTNAVTGKLVEGYNIESMLEGGMIGNPEITYGDLSFPGGELYSTREIIPGKHFLPVNKALFNNILSVMLTKKLIPLHKRGHSSAASNYGISFAESSNELNANLGSAAETDVGRMIHKLIGDLQPHMSSPGDKINKSTNLGFQLPPEFDFIHNSSVDPFQMIVIPFEHVFEKQDLIDMYQGVMPRISRFFEKLTEQTEVRPSHDTPSYMSFGTQAAPPEMIDVPPWLPYIPTGGTSAAASYYKGVFEETISTAMMSDSWAMGTDVSDEDFLRVMQIFEAGKKKQMDYGWTGESYDGDTKMTSWQEMFVSAGLSKHYGSGENLEKLQHVYNNYHHSLKKAIGQSPGGLGYSDSKLQINKQTLENLGLENFLCPPLRSGVSLVSHPLVQEYCDIANSTIPDWTAKQFYENLHFMVFKVKQRSAKDYKKYRERQIQQVLKAEYVGEIPTGGPDAQISIPGEKVLENITFGEVYGSNWPYDYFSLIESIKIDVEIKVGK